MRIDNPYLLGKMLKIQVQIQSGPAGPVRQIWVSGPVWSGNSYAQSGRALLLTVLLSLPFNKLPCCWGENSVNNNKYEL